MLAAPTIYDVALEPLLTLLTIRQLYILIQVALSDSERVSGSELDRDSDINLCSTLGSAYQLSGHHHTAKDVLERALRLCQSNNSSRNLQEAGIALSLGTAYRLER